METTLKMLTIQNTLNQLIAPYTAIGQITVKKGYTEVLFHVTGPENEYCNPGGVNITSKFIDTVTKLFTDIFGADYPPDFNNTGTTFWVLIKHE